MAIRQGRYTIIFDNTPSISGFAGVAGKKEGEGPLSPDFDAIYDDEYMGQESFEKAESEMVREAVLRALDKSGSTAADVDYIFSGDLLNQCIGTSYGIREFGIPFIGLYGACSTMALSLGLAGLFVESGTARRTIAATSSHFCSAERQFRYPLEYAGQRASTAQWTVTGSGACVVENGTDAPHIAAVTFGKIIDMGVKDIGNMGAAMAPAAASTIKAFLDDTQTSPPDYDLILTGDLGEVGTALLKELLQKDCIDITANHADCGLMVFDKKSQPDTESGGSGCGCSGSVLCSNVLTRIKNGSLNKVLFVGTGALMSPVSVQQGESIPSIAHAVMLTS